MTVSTELIDRINMETSQRLAARARQGRLRALDVISHWCVVVTDDGDKTRDLIFEKSPTIGQIAEQADPDAYLVSIGKRKKSLRERVRLVIAAE